MKAPKITVICRYIANSGNEISPWEGGYRAYCIKYDDGTYSSDFGKDRIIKEEIIYEGICPANLKVLPKVDKKYLYHHVGVISQKIPKSVDMRIADAVRGTCGAQLQSHTMMSLVSCPIYDRELYNDNGEIVETISKVKGELQDYIYSLLTEEDWKRIDNYRLEEELQYKEKNK